MNNTTEKGRVRYIVFREDDTYYGVALEFNLVVEGDDPQTTLLSLFEGIRGYVEATRKARVRPPVLNQQPSAEYARLWTALSSQKPYTPKPPEKPIRKEQVFTFGAMPQYA